MATTKVEVEVSKETAELLAGLLNLVLAGKEALADGFQPGSDLPVIATAAFVHLLPALEGATAIPQELRDDPAAFTRAAALFGADLYDVLAKKPE